MKLKIAAVAVALSALAPIAQANVANPQPSFNDAATPAGTAPVATHATTVQQLPQPSFNG